MARAGMAGVPWLCRGRPGLPWLGLGPRCGVAWAEAPCVGVLMGGMAWLCGEPWSRVKYQCAVAQAGMPWLMIAPRVRVMVAIAVVLITAAAVAVAVAAAAAGSM